MKIIESGHFPKEITLMCPCCACKFIAERGDIEIVNRRYVDNKSIPIGWVKCPECDYEITFDIKLDKRR